MGVTHARTHARGGSHCTYRAVPTRNSASDVATSASAGVELEHEAVVAREIEAQAERADQAVAQREHLLLGRRVELRALFLVGDHAVDEVGHQEEVGVAKDDRSERARQAPAVLRRHPQCMGACQGGKGYAALCKRAV